MAMTPPLGQLPTMVAIMLAALDVQSGMSVCEIGTGTGYNAALLAERLGAELVTTIEIDRQLAARARKALSDAGYGRPGRAVAGDDGDWAAPEGASDGTSKQVAAGVPGSRGAAVLGTVFSVAPKRRRV